MTDITLVLARFIGIYFMVAGLGVIMRRRTIGDFVRRYREDPVISFIAGVLALWFGLVVMALNWDWSAFLPAVITFIGLLAAVKGGLLIILGKRVIVLSRLYEENLHTAGIWGILITVIGALLTGASFAAQP
ncbi:hypothetical protein DDZ18_13595 [Marinicauda salina]|uniref:Uncharacterized protein n=1 Tax=Marinicauda salina TaxID=2135793 RepID=A0A2U2BR22_9PROT|nr:hypothetical protein [Marinicauda salina]PWE16446.1 hypothetical protein DDZ18_13595 [Marinicauda salina]